jgi:hypothetical protein
LGVLGGFAEHRLAGDELEGEVPLHDLAHLMCDLPALAALERGGDEEPEERASDT